MSHGKVHVFTANPHRSTSLPGTSLTDLAQTTVVSWVAFELFEGMFVTKHHVTPVPLDIGLGEPQSAALVSLRQLRGFLLFKTM